MQEKAEKICLDILAAAGAIQRFTLGKDLAAYGSDELTRAAVERKFEIIGEACTRLRELHPETFARIASAHQIIGFRNRLIHGYDAIDHGIVWDVLQSKLPPLLAEIKSITERR